MKRQAKSQPGRQHGHTDLTAKMPAWDEDELLVRIEGLDHPVLLLVLDGVTDPHNLGACLRTADAVGADAVIGAKDRAAPLNYTARLIACGGAEHVPYVQVVNLARTLESLRKSGVWVVGTADDSDRDIYDADLKGSLAIVLGAEGRGLRRLTRKRCDFIVRIPMFGHVECLNVSVAAGVCLFEAIRQRRR